MTQAAISYQTILKQARQLPPRARRWLAETLLRPTNGDEQTILISMRRFRQDAQARFQELMDRHNEGQLSPRDHEELKSLVARYEALMLLNTETLLKAAYPQLFTTSGRLRRKRLDRTPRRRARTKRSTPSN